MKTCQRCGRAFTPRQDWYRFCLRCYIERKESRDPGPQPWNPRYRWLQGDALWIMLVIIALTMAIYGLGRLFGLW